MKFITLILMAALFAWIVPALLANLSLRSTAAEFVSGLRGAVCTANAAALSDPARTANAVAATQLLAEARVQSYNPNADLRHGLVTTANASLFTEAFFSEPLTTYALGWSDPAGYDALGDFVAPPVLGIVGQLYEHLEYPNAEAFLSDDGTDDLRPINSDFKTVDYTWGRARREIPNRGLRFIVDIDRVRSTPNWQQHFTGLLMLRLARNAARRKVALALAAGTGASLTWDSNSDPDYDLANQAKLCGDSSGISPNRALWGLSAKLTRFQAYGGTNTAKAMAGRSLTPEQASERVGLQALVDESRYQTGATKTAIVTNKVLLFSAYGQSGEDPSNFKTARGSTEQGGRFAVYVRQLSVKFWEIVVECYEAEWVATTLGARTLTIS